MTYVRDIVTENINEKEVNSNNRNQFVSSVLDDDTLSVAYTSCSDDSESVSNSKTNECNYRQNFNCIENINPSDTNIGSVCVENSTNVTFGTVFHGNIGGNVMITQFIVDKNDVKINEVQECRDKTEQFENSKA